MDLRQDSLENLTLADLIRGDRPGMPVRTPPAQIAWWNVASVGANNIAYKDFQVRKGEMYIGVGNRVFIANSAGIRLGHEEWQFAPFRVDMQGNATLTNASLSGQISATSGTIGGFTITSTQMYGGIIKTSANVGSGGNGVVMDEDGLRGYSDILGLTFDLPANGDAPTFSSGVINNTVYNIKEASIIRTSESVGSGDSGLLMNSTGLYAVEEGQTLADANVKILSTGEATFGGYVKGGMTDYMVGSGYFLGFSNGFYRLAVGDPDGDNIRWDGSRLWIKGAMELDGAANLQQYEEVDLPVPPTYYTLTLAGAFE